MKHNLGRSRREFLKWFKFKIFDYIVLLISLVISIYVTRWALVKRNLEPILKITAPEGTWILDLNKNQNFDATGPLGVNHIVIKDKTVSIKTSPCLNQLCVRSGQISRSGQWIACLPNRIFVALEARKEDAFDAYSY